MNYGKFYIIPYHDKFMISRKGYIVNANTNELLQKYTDNNSRIYVILDTERLYLDVLLLNTFVGIINGNIIYNDGDYTNCKYKNLRYDTTLITVGSSISINGEIFKPIPNFDSYYISSNGVVHSTHRDRFISITYNHGNYAVATIINNDGYRAPQRIHRLVYTSFVGPISEDKCIDHLDNRKYNNNVSNLDLVFTHVNIRRALDDGLSNMRWSVDDINNICKMLEVNTPSKFIADSFNMQTHEGYRDLTMLIHHLTSGKQHVQITKNYDLSKYNSALNKRDRVLNENDVIYIWNAIHNDNEPIKNLADKFNVSANTITKIRDRKTWKYVTNELLAKMKVQRLEKAR